MLSHQEQVRFLTAWNWHPKDINSVKRYHKDILGTSVLRGMLRPGTLGLYPNIENLNSFSVFWLIRSKRSCSSCRSWVSLKKIWKISKLTFIKCKIPWKRISANRCNWEFQRRPSCIKYQPTLTSSKYGEKGYDRRCSTLHRDKPACYVGDKPHSERNSWMALRCMYGVITENPKTWRPSGYHVSDSRYYKTRSFVCLFFSLLSLNMAVSTQLSTCSTTARIRVEEAMGFPQV